MRRTPLLIVLLVGAVAAGAAAPVTVTTGNDWTNGTFTATTESGGALQLLAGQPSGSYDSRVFDLGDAYTPGRVAVRSALNGGAVDLTVETSTDDFASVQNSTTFSLSGGTEQFSLADFFDARYVRFTVSMSRGTDTPQVFGVNVSVADRFYFMLRSEPCRGGEEELFSLSNRSNAHVAEPGFYPQYRVCGSGLDSVAYRQVCTDYGGDIVSFFGSDTTVTHLSTDPDLFDYKLCTDSLSIGVRDSCPPTTKAMISIYDTPESHVAQPGVYGNHLCGGMIENVQAAMRFHLGQSDVYLNQTQNPAEGVYNATGWENPFIVAENTSMVTGLVAGEGTRTTEIRYQESQGRQIFNVTQDRDQTVSYYAPFTTGDHVDVADRQVLIQQQEFLSKVNPNFGLRFAQNMIVRLTYQFQDIDLVNDETVPAGVYDIILQHMGTRGDTTEVAVNVTAQ